MGSAGRVKSAEVFKNMESKSLGMGICDYSSSKEAEMAIKTLHGKESLGRNIQVQRYKDKGTGSQQVVLDKKGQSDEGEQSKRV